MRCALLLLVACSHSTEIPPTPPHAPDVKTGGDGLIAMIPDGAQVVIELDLARLRANPTVGPIVTKAIAAQVPLPGMSAPLADATQVVIAAYGVGTAQAATLTLVAATKQPADLPQVSEGVWGIGPPDWLGMATARAHAHASKELYLLRDHAMPKGAPGAFLRITARLPFDARVALGRQTGLSTAPAQLSLWADVADDLAIVVDADGEKEGGKAMQKALAEAIEQLARSPAVRALGATQSLENAKFVVQHSWVRAVIAIGPQHLQRIVARAAALLPSDPP